MIGLFQRILPRLVRQLTVVAVVVCIAALGAAGAGQMLCLSDCGMHQEVVSAPSCCEEDLEHAVMGAVEEGTHSTPLPSTCCEGTLCFDAPAASTELAATINGLEPSVAPTHLLTHQSVTIPAAALTKFSSDPPISTPPIPIYIRTCVYLI